MREPSDEKPLSIVSGVVASTPHEILPTAQSILCAAASRRSVSLRVLRSYLHDKVLSRYADYPITVVGTLVLKEY